MRVLGCSLLVLLALGCSHRATVGGLCPKQCKPSDCALGTCAPDSTVDVDSGVDPCPGAGCPVDAGQGTCPADGCRDAAGDAALDACAADGCSDAGPCGTGTGATARKRLDLIFVADDSASLAFWFDPLYLGFAQFLAQDASAGIGVGLQRFGEICEPQAFDQLLVPIAPLPGNLAAMQQALPIGPAASTSTLPAFDGALRYARSWMASHPESQAAVVLLTDATPGACDALTGDFNVEAPRLAQEAFEGTPSIKTYVVGVGVFPTLAAIATAGGTQVAMINIVPVDGEVLTALENIRADADPCGANAQTKP